MYNLFINNCGKCTIIFSPFKFASKSKKAKNKALSIILTTLCCAKKCFFINIVL